MMICFTNWIHGASPFWKINIVLQPVPVKSPHALVNSLKVRCLKLRFELCRCFCLAFLFFSMNINFFLNLKMTYQLSIGQILVTIKLYS